jgi:hypothetical protein
VVDTLPPSQFPSLLLRYPLDRLRCDAQAPDHVVVDDHHVVVDDHHIALAIAPTANPHDLAHALADDKYVKRCLQVGRHLLTRQAPLLAANEDDNIVAATDNARADRQASGQHRGRSRKIRPTICLAYHFPASAGPRKRVVPRSHRDRLTSPLRGHVVRRAEWSLFTMVCCCALLSRSLVPGGAPDQSPPFDVF